MVDEKRKKIISDLFEAIAHDKDDKNLSEWELIFYGAIKLIEFRRDRLKNAHET